MTFNGYLSKTVNSRANEAIATKLYYMMDKNSLTSLKLNNYIGEDLKPR